MRSIGTKPEELPKDPFKVLDPLIADLRSEKDKQHQTHPITAESDYSDSREARRL